MSRTRYRIRSHSVRIGGMPHTITTKPTGTAMSCCRPTECSGGSALASRVNAARFTSFGGQRPCGDALLGKAGAGAPRWHSPASGPRHAQGVEPGGRQRRVLARRAGRVPGGPPAAGQRPLAHLRRPVAEADAALYPLRGLHEPLPRLHPPRRPHRRHRLPGTDRRTREPPRVAPRSLHRLAEENGFHGEASRPSAPMGSADRFRPPWGQGCRPFHVT